jgi:hypothetical protein
MLFWFQCTLNVTLCLDAVLMLLTSNSFQICCSDFMLSFPEFTKVIDGDGDGGGGGVVGGGGDGAGGCDGVVGGGGDGVGGGGSDPVDKGFAGDVSRLEVSYLLLRKALICFS